MTQETTPGTAQELAMLRKPKWLVMIYLAGDNNLSANSIAIMQELEAAVPPSAEVRVVACFDSNTPRPRGARYVEVNYRRHMNHTGIQYWDLHNDLVPLGEIPGHPVVAPDFCATEPAPDEPSKEPVAKEGLSRFLSFALKKHQADRHMLIVFGHGTAVAGNTFLADDNPPSFLRLKDFAGVLARHFDVSGEADKPALDILACQNCAMNGIETAFQLRRQVKYMLGSQGLMLALGWPFRKIIRAVVYDQDAETKDVAVSMLKVCARNLIDFSLMDRSSEQSVCDLTSLGQDQNLVSSVRWLVAAMQEGLEFDRCGKLVYPAICDAIRLARLEAQSYWGETFVDLYDFCALLLKQCNEAMSRLVALFIQLNLDKNLLLSVASAAATDQEGHGEKRLSQSQVKEFLLHGDSSLRLFQEIAGRCRAVLEEIKKKDGFVDASYYIGPELQYSNGVSVYFPWSLPEQPIIFEPDGDNQGGSGGRYGISWISLDRLGKPPDDYIMRTAFDEYKDYDFAGCHGGDWAAFLERFFRATLRDVRRFDVDYIESTGSNFFEDKTIAEPFISPREVLPQKSGSDTGIEDFAFQTIKNYPRRFYISPADCLRRCSPFEPREEVKECGPRGENKEYCASYLGWNVRGIVAEVIGLEARRLNTDPSGATGDGSAAGAEAGQRPEEGPELEE